jgi:hypothetical protein
MSTVYKYCEAQGLKILQNLELKITPPNQFNDPFEFTPRVICSNPNRKFKNLLKDKTELREMYLDQKKAGFRGTTREFRRQLRQARPTLVAAIVPKMPEVSLYLQKNYLDTISKQHGLLCVSNRRESILMWGHYCDRHRGMVIGLERSWKLFQGEKGLHDVKYVRERVLWDSSWTPGGVKERSFIEQLVFWKNDEWKYEKELRQLFTLGGLPQRNLDNGTIGYFLPIPPETIVSVSLGSRCPSELKEKVRSALRDQRLGHVKLDQAVLHESDFALRFE